MNDRVRYSAYVICKNEWKKNFFIRKFIFKVLNSFIILCILTESANLIFLNKNFPLHF